MDYQKFCKEFENAMERVYMVLQASGAPEDAWINDYDIFMETMQDNVGEYLDDEEVGEGTESNPRFKCMEEGIDDEEDPRYDNAWYTLTLVNKDGETEELDVDITDQDYWGNINTSDGTCFWEMDPDDPREDAEFFDGIGYGNDEDGYKKIVKVKNINLGKNVPLRKFAKIVDANIDMFSDM